MVFSARGRTAVILTPGEDGYIVAEARGGRIFGFPYYLAGMMEAR
jgi:hypothetical protein